MYRGLSEKNIHLIIDAIKNSEDPKALSEIVFGTHEKNSILDAMNIEPRFIGSDEISVRETTRIFRKGIQKEHESEIVRLLKELLKEIKIQSEGFKRMQHIQQDRISYSAVIDLQKYIQETIDDYPSILEVFVEEIFPGRLLIYLIIPNDLSYKLHKPIARYQSILFKPFKEIIDDFRVVQQINRDTIIKRNLMKIV